ncbi:MAG: hypothetical protein ACREPA_01015 [Candidatus Dormibacteraceae bacterium]
MSATRGESLRRLRRLWDDHRRTPFPGTGYGDPRLQELALYESWLGTIVETTLAGGRLSAAHRPLLEARRREGNPGLWTAAAELGGPVRSFLARLIAIEDLLEALRPPPADAGPADG